MLLFNDQYTLYVFCNVYAHATIINDLLTYLSNLLSTKGPTCVLIKPDGQTLDSFGFDAESKYADLAEENAHRDYYYFKRFKMMLHGKIVIEYTTVYSVALCVKLIPC